MASSMGACQSGFALPSSIGRKKTGSSAVDALMSSGKNNDMKTGIQFSLDSASIKEI
jgi:hypothetical protein